MRYNKDFKCCYTCHWRVPSYSGDECYHYSKWGGYRDNIDGNDNGVYWRKCKNYDPEPIMVEGMRDMFEDGDLED